MSFSTGELRYPESADLATADNRGTADEVAPVADDHERMLMTTPETVTDDLADRRERHDTERDEAIAGTYAAEEFAGFGDPRSMLPLAVVTAGADAHEPEWHDRALCAQTDPEAFFPEKGGSTREAKKICTGCEVRAECLTYALAHDERFGIWGGMSERERRRVKRRAV